MSKAPVQVDVPVEDVDGDVAQGEDYPGSENARLFSLMVGAISLRIRSP